MSPSAYIRTYGWSINKIKKLRSEIGVFFVHDYQVYHQYYYLLPHVSNKLYYVYDRFIERKKIFFSKTLYFIRV